jgi:hypothetical protein
VKRLRPVVLATYLLALSGQAMAFDHLVPEDSPLALLLPNQYRMSTGAYLNPLAPALDRFVRVFSVQEGTPFPEMVVGLKQVDGVYNIFGAQPSGPTSENRRIRPKLPPLKLMGTDGKLHDEPASSATAERPLPYTLKTCRAEIDQKLAERVVRAWDKVLLQTRPEVAMPNWSTDGALVHFGSNTKYSVMTGVALDVSHDSPPGRLGLAAYDLTAICWGWKTLGPLDPKVELEQTLTKLEMP